MARKKQKKPSGGGAGWLVTFSDLVTLLLTFFVLLLSMASMDRSILTKVTLFTKDLGVMTYKGSGRIPTRMKILSQLLDKPWEVLEKQQRIKDLLFPDDIVPPEINRKTLMENLQILARPEGVALVLTDSLLFESGRWSLSERAKFVLGQVSEFLTYTNAPVNVSGYTDATPASDPDNFELSQNRAMSVLEFFLGHEHMKERFTVSGYGPNWPLEDNGAPVDDPARNRRVEILVKTTPWLGAYSQ